MWREPVKSTQIIFCYDVYEDIISYFLSRLLTFLADLFAFQKRNFFRQVFETSYDQRKDSKYLNNKMLHIGPYLVTPPSKPPPNHFLVVAGRQVFSFPSSAESARVACRYISI